MVADDDAPYPNPLDTTSGPTTQWTRNNVGEAFPGVVTPLHYDFVVRAGELGIRGAYAERGAITAEEAAESDVADERVMAAFKGRLAVNVDTMCAFGDRVSETAAAEIEFGLLGFVREDVERHPSTDRHALIAERDAEVRAGIDARAQGLVRRRGGLLACRDRPGRAGRRRRRPRPVARGVATGSSRAPS